MRLPFLLLAALLPGTAFADGLIGRTVTFHIETWDDPAAPLFQTSDLSATVGEGVELDVEELGRKAGFDLIPLFVDVTADTVILDYSRTDPQDFYKSRFNGYVLDFGPGCPSVRGARFDPDRTTLPIGNKRLQVRDGTLWVNVSALVTGRGEKAVINLDLDDCKKG